MQPHVTPTWFHSLTHTERASVPQRNAQRGVHSHQTVRAATLVFAVAAGEGRLLSSLRSSFLTSGLASSGLSLWKPPALTRSSSQVRRYSPTTTTRLPPCSVYFSHGSFVYVDRGVVLGCRCFHVRLYADTVEKFVLLSAFLCWSWSEVVFWIDDMPGRACQDVSFVGSPIIW